METFTNILSGAEFCEKNGRIIIKEKSGNHFFSSMEPKAIYTTGYISNDAFAIIEREMSHGSKLKDVISTFLDFAIINYIDDKGEKQSCPTLMPKFHKKEEKKSTIYPLISEYIEAIKNAEDNFNKLSYLRPVLDDEGNPIMSNGNFAVVFKMTDGEKNFAIKCFLKYQKGREEAYRMISSELKNGGINEMVKVKYYENELFVDCKQADNKEFPVLFMDWVDGITLEDWLVQNEIHPDCIDVKYNRLRDLCIDLLSSHVAHGDIKPDNILIEEHGIKLIDLDGMFVPNMYGTPARELGTPGYAHPRRSDLPFDEHIDDYSCIILLLCLKLSILSRDSYSYIFQTGVDSYLDTYPVYKLDKEVLNLYLAYQYVLVHGRLDNSLIPYLLNVVSEEKHEKEVILKRKAKDGNTIAMLQLSNYYMLIGDYSNAYKWADFSHKMGNVNAECNMCKCYRYDNDLIINGGRKYGNSSLELLASKNTPFSLCYRGEGYLSAGTFEEKESSFLHAANMGSVGAERWLGTIYKEDWDKSLYYLKAAAAKGFIVAQRRLGEIFQKEIIDYKESFRYYFMAASQEDAESMYRLGEMYESGQGVPIDKVTADEWFQKAINAGFQQVKKKQKSVPSANDHDI